LKKPQGLAGAHADKDHQGAAGNNDDRIGFDILILFHIRLPLANLRRVRCRLSVVDRCNGSGAVMNF
jgi:hypothetical protein